MAIPLGISIPQTFYTSAVNLELIRQALQRAETLGFDSVWVQEQMITDVAILEPVSLLTYAAALTTRVRLGVAVLLSVIRNPVELAKTLATLDQLSQGRLRVDLPGNSKVYRRWRLRSALQNSPKSLLRCCSQKTLGILRRKTMAEEKKTLYERLGGHDAIAAVANDLLPRLQADAQLGRFWAHRAEDGVKREKQLLIDFLCASAGGPMYYRGRDIRDGKVNHGPPN